MKVIRDSKKIMELSEKFYNYHMDQFGIAVSKLKSFNDYDFICTDDESSFVVITKKDGKIFIKELFVDEKHRRTGVGKQLLKFIKTMYPRLKMELRVLNDNRDAILFYKSCNFKFTVCGATTSIMEER